MAKTATKTAPAAKMTKNMDAFTKNLTGALKSDGFFTAMDSVEEHYMRAHVAQLRDDFGIAPGEPVPRSAARFAAMELLRLSRHSQLKSTSHSSNLSELGKLRALAILAEDYQLDVALREQMTAARETGEVVED